MRSSFILFALLVGCARAEYVDSPSNPVRPPTKASCEVRCDYRLASGSCVELNWEKVAVKKEFGQFVIKITRANLYDQSPTLVDSHGIEAFLWMPSMGHGSSPLKIDKVDSGIYRISRVYFSMPGDWEIHIKISADKATDELVIPYHY